MTRAERAREWARFAEDDLRSAKVLLEEGIFNEVCFHSQQCAEKILKAFLVLNGAFVPKTHRLVDILGECIKANAELENVRHDCLVLDQFYIPTRYPDALIGSKALGLPSRNDAQEALGMAESILKKIRSILDHA